ncbi:hypothetical protein ACFOOM_26545 [Streptomyces echinoruber]|uniref:Low molecular weight antigen MTB12-like C-terminal domain-containing protein n=1 Tax=Streptomyces echinoruber TaxID=68898 RepID=A0A918RU82_9ACTN|nr:hypothetical protein [Streptomyces echinoruber]GHA11148.1 hypothetical protein GCM10010389_57810 [Streptomyces echinoruber]
MVLGSDPRRGETRRGRCPRAAGRGTAAAAAALVLILAPSLAACSNGKGNGYGGGTSSTPPASSAQKSTGTPPTGPEDPAAAQREIKQNWQKFFDPATPLKEKQAVLENGARMTLVLRAFSGDQRGRQVRAQVTKVVFTSPTQAGVTYDLLLKGATALPGAAGTAVQQDGTWKVSDKTLCALVQMSGHASASALPGC